MENEEISFGRFRLHPRRRELLRDEVPVRLHRRALDILCALAVAKGAIVGKDELLALLWPGRIVEEGNLHVHVSALRKALGEDGEGHSYIVTVPGRGYRLAGFTGAVPADSAAAPSPRPLPPPASEAEIAEADTRHVGVLGKPPATLGTLGGGRRGRLPRRWLLWGGSGVIAGALCLAVFIGVSPGRPDHRLLSEDGPSIVVMPFRDFGEKGQFKLGDSIADGLARELSQLPGSQIVSSETARAYSLKSLDARQIRRELGAAYIVAGSVASAQPGLHVEATLSKTLNDTVISPLTVDVDETDTGAARDNIVTGLIWPLATFRRKNIRSKSLI
jgi:DNA-binding winged helix-turn-helix (wHTH) protein/TolB-like protein